jgi:Protein of unknown function (DUF3261)
VRRGAALFAAGVLALAAPGCVTLAMLRPLPRACPGPLLPVAEMGPDFALRARYRVRSDGRELALLLAAEKRGGRLVLLGLDPLGTDVFTLVQEGDAVRRERHLRPLFPFAPENALRDLERVRFADRLAEADRADGTRVTQGRGGATVARPACDWEATIGFVGGRETGGGPGEAAGASPAD